MMLRFMFVFIVYLYGKIIIVVTEWSVPLGDYLLVYIFVCLHRTVVDYIFVLFYFPQLLIRLFILFPLFLLCFVV